jgi:hypothetical protein
VSETLPAELLNRCAAIEDSDVHGLPLLRRDYLWFVVATVVVPAILIIIGVLL